MYRPIFVGKTNKMNIQTRKATKEDATLIAQVVAMAIGDESATDYCGKDYLNVLEEIVRMEDTQYSYRNTIIAECDGSPAGALVGYDGGMLHPLRKQTLAVIHRYNPGLVMAEDETQAGEFYMDSLGVLPKFRGTGVGKALLLAMREKAFAEGHERVGLLVDFENPKAERLYLSIGFEWVDTKVFLGHRMWHLQCSK